MYTRPMIYKVYSIIVFVIACISFLSNIAMLLIPADLFLNLPIQTKETEMITLLINVIKWSSVPSCIISLFFAYVEFSSMFTFSDMINYVRGNSNTPFQKRAFVLPAKFYIKFGNVITFISFVVSTVCVIVMIISYSITQKAFLAIPVLRILPVILSLILVYITYYVRYRAFGTLLNLLSKNNPVEGDVFEVKDNKPGLLRGYCTFLFIFAFVFLAVLVVICFIFAGTISSAIGVLGTVIVYLVFLLGFVVYFLELAVTGCYFDDLAKMVENYWIKYNLLDK